MTGNDYQRLAYRTVNEKAAKDKDYAVLNGALGLCGEAGEVADVIKKHMFQGHELDTEKIADELGDVLWYIALIAGGIGATLDEILDYNIRKLKKRYPAGFEETKSIHREE
jgi:NTP pyrophosphatase (non-canonical NTP hydrolase)